MIEPGKLYTLVGYEFWLLTDIHHGAAKLTFDEQPFLVLSVHRDEHEVLVYYNVELLTCTGTVIKGMQRDLWFNEAHLTEVQC